MLRIGIDIGSTTVKTVVLSDGGELLFRSYERHGANPRLKASEQLMSAADAIGDNGFCLAVTGSAGLGVAKAAGLPFRQEVYATAAAVRKLIPDADAVIELGGEDAKIIFLGGSLEERMNGSCAGGTGAFIDQMATLLAVTPKELDELSLRHERIYPIASRCGVFAKSDIQPILNQGGQKEDIAASIYQAVVDQTVSGLSQGRELTGKLVFLGGPLTFLTGLRERFTETLALDAEHAVFPENSDVFAAIGAAIIAEPKENEIYTYDSLLTKLTEAHEAGGATDTLQALFESPDEYTAFCERHAEATPPVIDSAEYRGAAYLGVDAGSTTTKLVLISPEGAILHSYYAHNKGDPVSVVLNELKAIYSSFGDRIHILAAAATGYGEELVKNAFNLDYGIVETIAHLTAAQKFRPNVDFILDIGGQDVKCFKIKNDGIDSIMLNEACSSGCGSFIETFANALGYEIADFSKIGLFAEKPVNLGSRCTVFMNSSVKQSQKEGASVEQISAGLSMSIVKNALYKVIRAASADDIGQNIVVQGGTFYNDAVLRAFEKEIGRDVTRPTIAGLMGAYGAALYAAEQVSESDAKSSILSMADLAEFTHSSRSVTCNGCGNHCPLAINTFSGGRRYISGNRCSKPLGITESIEANMMKWKYDKLLAMEGNGRGDGSRGTIGIPLVLNMYENLPFWFEFFTKLNFSVKLSEKSTRALYVKGQRTIPSDTVCYPAKLAHGHLESLAGLGLKAIFYPCLPYNFNEGISDNHYNCPVVAYYPELLNNNMPALKSEKFLLPYFGLHREADFIRRAGGYFETELGVPKKETAFAARAAFRAYNDWREEIKLEGGRIIRDAAERGVTVIIAAGRPYHIDPEINHGIDTLITGYNLALVTEDAVSADLGYEKRRVLNQWTYHARMYNAARFAAQHSGIELIQLVSFGCGTDAITGDEMRDILESHGKLYTQIKIDDISNLGAVRIRVRSLIAASERRANTIERNGTNG